MKKEARFLRVLAKSLSTDLGAEQVERETVLDVSQSGASAVAVTSGHGERCRRRYHLRKRNDAWDVWKMERECPKCCSTGKVQSAKCDVCAGAGWMDR